MSARFRVITFLLLGSLALAASGQAASNHYRWKDAQGKTVYSDRPPPTGINYEIVSSSSPNTRAVDTEEGAMSAANGDSAAAAEQLAQEKQAEDARQRADLCARATSNLEALSGSAKIVVRTPEGEQRALSDSEIAQQRNTARSQVNAYCN